MLYGIAASISSYCCKVASYTRYTARGTDVGYCAGTDTRSCGTRSSGTDVGYCGTRAGGQTDTALGSAGLQSACHAR
eukprot:638381-Rhodomonas_salina.1